MRIFIAKLMLCLSLAAFHAAAVAQGGFATPSKAMAEAYQSGDNDLAKRLIARDLDACRKMQRGEDFCFLIRFVQLRVFFSADEAYSGLGKNAPDVLAMAQRLQIKDGPEIAEIYLYAAIAQHRRTDREAALDTYQTALAKVRRLDGKAARLIEAETLKWLGKWHEDGVSWKFGRASREEAEVNYLASIAIYDDQLVSLDADVAEVYGYYAAFLAKSQRYEQALAYRMAQIGKLRALDFAPGLTLAEAYLRASYAASSLDLREDQLQLALAGYTEAKRRMTKDAPDLAYYVTPVAMAYESLGRFDESIPHRLEEVRLRERDPSNPMMLAWARFGAGLAQLKYGDVRDGRIQLETLVKDAWSLRLQPNGHLVADALEILAEQDIREGRWQSAEERLRLAGEVFASNPNYGGPGAGGMSVYPSLGLSLLMQRTKLPEARTLFRFSQAETIRRIAEAGDFDGEVKEMMERGRPAFLGGVKTAWLLSDRSP